MHKCQICNESKFSKYPYSNHLDKINKSYIKHLVARMLLPILKIIHRKYYNWVSMKMLFSPSFYIVRCNTCGYGIYDRHIGSELIEKYYKTVYWNSKGLPQSQWHQQHHFMQDTRAIGQYRCIQNWVKQFADMNVLEIGAGSAFFSRLLKEKQPNDVRLSIVEPGHAWELYYKSLDITLIAKYFPFESDQKFHYIHTSHWLEHVSNLAAILSTIKSLLITNGILFIEVPNCNDEYYSHDVSDVPHLHFFTKDSLCALLENNGFKMLTLEEYGFTYLEDLNLKNGQRNLDTSILQDGELSILENIPRKGGSTLRGVFQVSG